MHLIVTVGLHNVELQLRTPRMQYWAQTVEAFSALLGENYKRDGNHPVQQYLKAASEIAYAGETGLPADPDATDTLERLEPEVLRLVERAGQLPTSEERA